MKKKLAFILMMILLLTACQKQDEKQEATDNSLDKVISVEVAKAELLKLEKNRRLAGNVASDELVVVTPKLTMPATVTVLNFSEGDWVYKDDILMKFKINGVDEQISLAKSQYDLAQANYQLQLENYNFALDNLARTKVLYQNGAVSKVALEQAELAASPHQLNSLKQQLNQAKEAYELQLSRAEDKTLLAPVSGRISMINATVGAAASVQTSIAIIKDGKLAIDFSLPETLRNELKVGDKVSVILTADGSSYAAYIASISPALNRQTSMFEATAILTDDIADNMKVYAGMNVDVVLAENQSESLTIPVDAMQEDKTGTYVYIADNGVAKKQAVKSGFDNGEVLEIIDGLSAEDEVIVVGQDFVKEGTQIKIVGGE